MPACAETLHKTYLCRTPFAHHLQALLPRGYTRQRHLPRIARDGARAALYQAAPHFTATSPFNYRPLGITPPRLPRLCYVAFCNTLDMFNASCAALLTTFSFRSGIFCRPAALFLLFVTAYGWDGFVIEHIVFSAIIPSRTHPRDFALVRGVATPATYPLFLHLLRAATLPTSSNISLIHPAVRYDLWTTFSFYRLVALLRSCWQHGNRGTPTRVLADGDTRAICMA